MDISAQQHRLLAERAHYLSAVHVALNDWDTVSAIVAAATDRQQATIDVAQHLGLDELQAKVVLDLPLAFVARSHRNRVAAELDAANARLRGAYPR